MEQLLQTDTELLLFINSHCSPFWDQLMWYASAKWTWLPLYALLLGLLVYKYRPANFPNAKLKGWLPLILVIVTLAITVGLCDFTTSGILKKLVCRPRPTHEPALEGLIHLVNGYTGGHYGFPSSHAANTFGVATLFSLLYSFPTQTKTGGKLLRFLLYFVLFGLYACLNCYSRMYLGVHYPLDIFCGATIGILLALATGLPLRRFISSWG